MTMAASSCSGHCAMPPSAVPSPLRRAPLFWSSRLKPAPSASGRRASSSSIASLRELERRSWDASFDPRDRPWYRLATEPGKRILTDPYVFATTRAPGVTLAVRSRASSVVGLDLTLAQISDRLAALRSFPGMKIVLFDSQRRLLARADVTHTMVRVDGERVSLATLDQFGEPVLAGLQPLTPGAEAATDLRLAADGREWKASVLPIPTTAGLLSLAIAVPVDELLKDARAARTRGLLAALAVLALSVPLTWWVAHHVARKLRDITRQAEEIRAFKFDGRGSRSLDGAGGRSALRRHRNDPRHDPAFSRHRHFSRRGNQLHALARSRRARDLIGNGCRGRDGVPDR